MEHIKIDILSQIQINFVLSILLTILFGHAYFKMNIKKINNRLFMWIMGLTLLVLILEIFSVILNGPDFKKFIIINKIVNVIGFAVAPSIPFLGYLFSNEWVNRYREEKIKLNKILILPLIINGIGAILSYNWGILFLITQENRYERGPLFFVLPCVSYIYFVISLYFIYRQRKKFIDSEFVLISLFFIVPAVFTIIQLKYYIYLTSWNSAAMIIIVFYIFILNDQLYHDSLTGLQNRLFFENYIEGINDKKRNSLFLIYIDLDDFKVINDKYGHSVGDEAIRTFADLLIENFHSRHKKIIRLGGDEFLILINEKQQEKVENYINNFIQQVDKFNIKAEKQYILKFSYGMACYTNVHKNLSQLLQNVDKLMYQQKQVRKNKMKEI